MGLCMGYTRKNGTNRFSMDFTLWAPRTNINYLLARSFLILTYYRWKQFFGLPFHVEKEEKKCYRGNAFKKEKHNQWMGMDAPAKLVIGLLH